MASIKCISGTWRDKRMRTDNPPDRVIRIIADMIRGGRLLTCPASMFSAERFNGAFHGIAITIMSRTDCSDVFFVAVEL